MTTKTDNQSEDAAAAQSAVTTASSRNTMPMLASVDSPKAEPGDVARAVLDGVESGSEDIAPDQFSSGACPGWRGDPKALEQQLAAY